MNLLQQFTGYIRKEQLFDPSAGLLLAVSGGVDSVVLCDLCDRAGFHFTIAHCNFQLRAEESIRDEAFVQQLGKKYNKEVLVKRFDTRAYAAKEKVSTQVAARDLRYQWFDELAEQLKINNQNSKIKTNIWLLTAHHLDDNIETMLMNLFRGTGIAGLRGMLPKQDNIIRPLLFATRESILQYASENNITWVEDSSNSTDDYTRNYFRHQVIPLVEKMYPGAVHNLGENIDRFRDIELLYQQAMSFNKKKLLTVKGNEIHIPVLRLKKTAALSSVVYEITKEYGFGSAQSGEIISLLDSDTGKYIESSSHRIIKNRQWLIIAPKQNKESATILVEESTTKVEFAGGVLSFSQEEQQQGHQFSKDNRIACLDASAVQFPLLLRKWKDGDYFYPLGMPKKKKLARFLIDQKFSKTGKESVWVIESAKKIIWVVGHRIDDRCKVRPSTKKVLRIALENMS